MIRPRPLSSRPRRTAAASAAIAVAAALIAGALGGQPASAAPAPQTYHVDCHQASNGDGSLQHPWNSLNAANSHAAFQPGESLLLKRGTKCSGSLHPKGSGKKGSPIVLGAYGSSKSLPTINGGGTRIGTGAVQLVNQAYWTVQDLHVTNRNSSKETTAYRSGVLLRSDGGGRLSGLTLQRLQIDSVVSNLMFGGGDAREFGGISALSAQLNSKNSGFEGLQILHNTIRKVGRTGIAVSNHGTTQTQDRNVRIAYNKIVKARGDSIVLRGSVNARIDHNVSAGGADFWPCKQCGAITPYTANAAIWPAGSRNTIIEHNEIYGEHAVGGDGEGIDVDMSAVNTTVQYNYIHDNDGGGILFCGSNDTTARFNILQNNKLGAFTFIRSIPATNTKIYNNTVYSRSGNTAKVVRSFGEFPSRTNTVKGITFFNNLIFNLDDSGFFVWPTTPKSKTNTYVGVHGIGEPADAGKGYVNPGVRRPGTGGNGFGTLNGYKVTKNAYTMAGSPIPGSVKKDFFGKTINPKKPPRGAAG